MTFKNNPNENIVEILAHIADLFEAKDANHHRIRAYRDGDVKWKVNNVRRGCGKCLPCLMNRSDMCQTGDYRERGILGMDGYQTEFVVDKEQYLVQVPPELASIGVLTEPLSVVEKAIEQALAIQSSRLPDAPTQAGWLHNCRCLVAGLGPIGLLAAIILRLRGTGLRSRCCRQGFGASTVARTSRRKASRRS